MTRLLAIAALAACSSSPRPPAKGEVVASADDPKCLGVVDPTRVVVTGGRTTPFGAATIVGHSGVFEIAIGATVQTWTPAKPDFERFVAVGSLCIRAIDASTLDVADRPGAAPLPAPHVDQPRCAIQCCDTEEKRKPAPGGEIECCFCNE
ncbi:MAG: hypothetical protein NT062_39670 [Proteobacteria bacterium]|nr:hypothetical protein [Pseudomonadota bacterium]